MASRYRLRMTRLRRAATTAVLVVVALLLVPGIVGSGLEPWWRVLSAAGLASAIAGLRIVLGPVLVVREEGLLILRHWPLRRDIPWYRILQIDVIPGFWHLEVELNSGERIALPCVDDIDGLYRNMERHRQALDA
jgi:hypothetical protein